MKMFDGDIKCGKYDEAIAAKDRTENEHKGPCTKISIVYYLCYGLNRLDRGPKRYFAVSKI